MAKVNNAAQLMMIQGLEFPDYEFREYPKMVKSATETDGKGQPLMVTVNSKAEEEKATHPPEGHDKPEHETLPAGRHPAQVRHDKPEEEELPQKTINSSAEGIVKPSVTFAPKAPTQAQAAKGEAEKLAQTPGGVAKA